MQSAIRDFGFVPFAVVLLAGVNGCQSGSVAGVQSSADGRVIAFHDLGYDQLYIADAKGVRAIGEKYDRYVLSPDGQWLAVFRQREEGHGIPSGVGDFLLLIELTSGRRFSTSLPVAVRSDWESVKDQDLAGPTTRPGTLSRLGKFVSPTLRFEAGPKVVITLVNGEGWVWQPRAASGTGWTRAPVDSRGERAASSFDTRPIFDESEGSAPAEPSWIIQLPCDGWNAPRTVWVRPDGSVMELDRQNDIPGWCMVYGPLVVIALPFAIVVDGVFLVCEPKLTGEATRGVVGFPCLLVKAGLEQLKVEPDAIRDARERLESELKQCPRGGATAGAGAPAQ